MPDSNPLRSAAPRSASPRPRRIWLWAAAALLTAGAASAERTDFDVRVFRSAPGDSRLPVELRAPLAPPLLEHGDLLGAAENRDVEIRWIARESLELAGYRVTATLDGGALSGLTTQWSVPAGGGSDAASGARAYRLRLPVHAAGAVRLHTALEAVREDGSLVLLAVLDSEPQESLAPRSGDPRVSHGALAPREVAVVPVGKSALRPLLLATSAETPAVLGARSQSASRTRSQVFGQRQSRAPPSA